MCGIAGIWERSGQPVEREALERMGALLAHRGPDGSGVHVSGEIGLANRRLRIVDVRPAADQPLALPEAGLWVTFNGEIHNYLELRRELEAGGARFRTTSDTEVVLHAFAAWDVDCFERFNGMWGLALWDERQRRLVLSRDRFGIKPVYYSVRGQRICFASEPKAIVEAFPCERRPDMREVERFLSGGFPDAGAATFFANVKSLRPGTYAVVSRDGMRSASYWDFTPGVEDPNPRAEEEFRELLTDAVRLRQRSDVPVGACVSGGLDSTAVIGVLDPPRDTVHCFSLKVDDPRVDESRYSKLVADRWGLVMHWVRPEPSGMLDTIRSIVWHHDAPTPIRGRLAEWFVMREAGGHVRVTLDGQGGDELLAGYPWDTVPYLIDRVRGRDDGLGWRRLAREAGDLNRVMYGRPWALAVMFARFGRELRPRIAGPYGSALNNFLWRGLRAHGLPELLHSQDALSMAFSVESRPPFLDHRLVELCFSLPFHDKISDGWTKSLLRRSLGDVLPPEVRTRRRKLGFQLPVAEWMRLPDNLPAICELLLDSRARDREILGHRRVELELRAFRRGTDGHARRAAVRLWRWVTLELWFRDFVDGEGFQPARG